MAEQLALRELELAQRQEYWPCAVCAACRLSRQHLPRSPQAVWF
jgi:hypothetical protein